MGLELAEQFDWSLPDVILYPTGGGTGLIGMWKAFAEVAEIGWPADQRQLRMVSCQSDGGAPFSAAWAAGRWFAGSFPNAVTAAGGLRVPAAVGGCMIIDAVNESGSQARACPDRCGEAVVVGLLRAAIARHSRLKQVWLPPTTYT